MHLCNNKTEVFVVGHLFSSQNRSKSSSVSNLLICLQTPLLLFSHWIKALSETLNIITNVVCCRKFCLRLIFNETMMATEVAHSLSVFDAINFMSAF